MSAVTIGAISCACAFGGVLAGMLLRSALPEHHLSDDSKDAIKVGMGLVGTMAALVLGLLVASAKSSFDLQNSELKQSAANALLLDRTLAHYGPETKDIRDAIRGALATRLKLTWPDDPAQDVVLEDTKSTPTIEGIEAKIRKLAPSDDDHRWLQSRALQIIVDLQQTRWLLFGGLGDSIQTPFLVILIVWITLMFVSFGLFAPPNTTVLVVLLIASVSISGAIYLIVELDRPFEGLMKIPSAPLRYTLAHLGQ